MTKYSFTLIFGLSFILFLMGYSGAGFAQANASKQEITEVTKGLRVEVGPLSELAAGGKIQQFYIWNRSNKPFKRLKATIYLYDKQGNQIGTVHEEHKEGTLEPGVAWAFYLELKKNVATTKVVKVIGE